MEGRPMQEWIQIPYKHKDRWKTFARISANSVEALKKDEAKAKPHR
jgi:hypothetical protein